MQRNLPVELLSLPAERAAIAKRLTDDGEKIAITYAESSDKAKSVVRDIEGNGRIAVAFKADRSDSNHVIGQAKAVVERFDRLDIQVNNAGVAAPCADLPILTRRC